MKSKLMKLGKVLLMIPCLVFLVNCSKSSKNNNNQCYQPYNQYGQYGQTGQQYYNPNCNYNNGINNGGYGEPCMGTYWYQGQPVLCESSMQCSGWTLQRNQAGPNAAPTQPGATVRCQ